MQPLISPITGLPNTKIITSISKEDIIQSYYDDLGMSVERFFNGISKIDIVKCKDTGYLFYHPSQILGDEKFYDDLKIQMPLNYNVSYYSDWKWEYQYCLGFIKPSDKVYEIGCGSGNFLEKLKKEGIIDVSGAELNNDSVNMARRKGLDVEHLTIEDKAKVTIEQFDVVCAFQVLEHVFKVKSFLDASINILKKGGLLIFAVPYNYPFLFKNDKLNTLNMPPHHMGLWNRDTFQNLSKFYSLQLETLVIEKLPSEGYDFEQFYKINKDINYCNNMPYKLLYDKLFYFWLKIFHTKYSGKNIIAILKKL
jgi:2-polyprenyl-3-methyl-5-hydroxy-6-metoxy-1,4-benzoquinol methylase